MSPDSAAAMTHDHERKIIRLETTVEMQGKDIMQLKDELKVYQAATIGQNKKMDALLAAIVGDDALKTKGLMQRIESIEVVTDMVKEIKWKFAGALVVVGWAMAFAYWALEKIFK